MRYTRLFAADDGESHFEDVDVGFNTTDYVQSAEPLSLSPPFSAANVAFMRAPAGWHSDFHVSSARNLFFVLTGEWEVTASDGEARRFGVGSVLLVEDRNGKGHSSRVLGAVDSTAAMVQLSD